MVETKTLTLGFEEVEPPVGEPEFRFNAYNPPFDSREVFSAGTRARRGERGNVVSRLPDGRIVLFTKPYNELMEPNQIVEVRIVNVQHNYIIVEPTNEPPSIEGPEIEEIPEIKEIVDIEDDSLIKKLERISEEGYGDTAIIAGGLLHIIVLQGLIVRLIREKFEK